MCCRELLVMVLLDNPGSVGTAIIGLWVVLACLGTHVKRPQTHLNEDSVACIHFLYAWEVTGLSCNGAGITLALWTCLLLASQHGHQASSRHSEAANVVAMACWCHERGLNHILLGKHLNWKALLNTKCCCLIRNQLLLHGQTTCQERIGHRESSIV
jgi:hypothetical protein